MESRKRSYVDEGELIVNKKRILSNGSGSPVVNGTVSELEELPHDDNLELFRKEAIYRRMKHYSRQHERSQARIEELERRKSTCEAGLAAMSACWSQLVETIRALIEPEDQPQEEKTRDLFDLTAHMSEPPPPGLVTALQANMEMTSKLVSKFANLGGESWSSLSRDDTYLKCQRAQTECAALRCEINIMRVKLDDSESQKERFRNELVAAESRVDRLRSRTVLEMQGPREKQEIKEDTLDKPEEKVEEVEEVKPSLAESTPINGHVHDNSDSPGLEEVSEFREAKIIQLEKDIAALRNENYVLSVALKSPSSEHLCDVPQYKILLDHCSRLEHTVRENQADITRLNEELTQMRMTRNEISETTQQGTAQMLQELKTVLAKRDLDNARLRDQREQLTAEINERKHKETVKLASLQELKSLANSRSERLAILQAELTRHKAQLAANAGSKDILMFLLDGSVEHVALFPSLTKKLAAVEERAAVLEQSLNVFQDGNPDVVKHMKTEADARQQLTEVQAQLEQYQRVYGDVTTFPPDVHHLAESLRLKQGEIDKLHLQGSQHTQAESSLYSELDKLSTAWEALDRQVQSKVFDLTAMEERVTKSTLDKAKSENKFYAAMRDKEAIDTERKSIARNLEKQSKVLEKLTETKENLQSQLIVAEAEAIMLKKASESKDQKIWGLETEVSDLQHQVIGERKRGTDIAQLFQSKEMLLDKRNVDLRKLEETLLRRKKELEEQASTSPDGDRSKKEAALQEEVNKCMTLLKCSTCKQQMRSVVLTKCMHTFCKPCVDARISTRQRKCPACNALFAQSDVQPIYLQ